MLLNCKIFFEIRNMCACVECVRISASVCRDRGVSRCSPKQLSVLIWEEEGAGRGEDSRGEGIKIIKENLRM